MNRLIAKVIILAKVIRFENSEIIPVEFIQPVPGAKPHITGIVLSDAINRVNRQAFFNLYVFGSDLIKAEIIILCKRFNGQEQYNKKRNQRIYV
jgi:hypothetical protein